MQNKNEGIKISPKQKASYEKALANSKLELFVCLHVHLKLFLERNPLVNICSNENLNEDTLTRGVIKNSICLFVRILSLKIKFFFKRSKSNVHNQVAIPHRLI